METEKQAQLKIKINNSYESEPSSGSGSSLGDQHDGPISDEDNIHFPYLVLESAMKTPSAITTPRRDQDNDLRNPNSNTKTNRNVNESNKKKNRKLVYGRPAHSSQESPFEGFGDTPPDDNLRDPLDELIVKFNLKMRKYNKTRKSLENQPIQKSTYTSFYDTMVEENSCNAVDMQLSNEPVIKSQTSSESNDDNQHLANNLSFNGKIKSLQSTQESEDSKTLENPKPIQKEPNVKILQRQSNVLEMSLNTSKFSESFILKKYSNERSPDLFGDDEDEGEEDEAADEDEEEPEENENDEHGNDIDNDKEVLEEQEENEELEMEESANQLQTKNKCPTSRHFKQQDEFKINYVNQNKNKNEEKQPANELNISLTCPTETSFAEETTMDSSMQMTTNDPLTLFRNNCRKERELLKRIKQCLAGVPPPPSFTIPQLDMFTAVLDKKTEILNYLSPSSSTREKETPETSSAANNKPTLNSIFRPTHSLEETKQMGWRDILGVRHHGVHYNLTKASENNEYLSLSVIERFIGAETATSYRNSPSSAKKRNSRLKLLTQSPGNRLSHLAKRRAIFSSANLASTSLKSTSSLGPQIVIDKKKSKHRRKATPKRMTPASKKKFARKTPSSSARKRLYRCDIMKPGPSRETSKRALFQSPAKPYQKAAVAPPKPPSINPEIANRVEKSKRALFSPEVERTSTPSSTANVTSAFSLSTSLFNSKQQFAPKVSPQLETFLKRKRNFTEDDDDITGQHTNKLFKGSSDNLTPRALKIKSQSFCIGAGSSMSSSASTISSSFLGGSGAGFSRRELSSQSSLNLADNRTLVKLQRASSEVYTPTNNLTENQKKKLLWAVSQALQEKKITSKHESFKQYASVLARVVKRIFTEYYQKTSTSNSETMLRLAKRYAFNVISGKNLDDIYLQAKQQIDESKRHSSTRLSGYIGREEYQQRQLSQQVSESSMTSSSFTGSMHNLFSTENSIDSFSVTLLPTATCTSTSSSSSTLTQPQNLFLEHISQEKVKTQSPSFSLSTAKSNALHPNALALSQNSSSKSNLGSLALRENVDGEQRRSAQKNFTGKDQRNVSPYIKGSSSASNARSLLGSGRKVQSEYFSDLQITGGSKVKRQILFDS